MMRQLKKSSGFTLVELMVVMVISGIIIGAIYSVYRTQQKTYTVQDQVAEMQQNLRAALMIMAKDFRSASYDPTFSDNFGITGATNNSFVFTADFDGNGSVDDSTSSAIGRTESLTYELYTPTGANITSLQRTATGSAVADNIEAIEFCYDTITTLNAGTGCTTAPADLDDIRAVQISILARASKPDRQFVNGKTYTTASGVNWGLYTDNYRRRLIITTVKLRNMGLR